MAPSNTSRPSLTRSFPLPLLLLLGFISYIHSASRVNVRDLSWKSAVHLDSEESMWLLGLHAGDKSRCSANLVEFQNTINEMQEVVDVGLVTLRESEVDEASNKYGSELDVLENDPCQLQLVLLPFGAEKDDIDDYQVYDGSMDGKELQNWVTSFIPDFTQELGPGNMELFISMPASSAMETGDDDEEDEDEEGAREGEDGGDGMLPPKVVLLTNKDQVPGVLKALALRFRSTDLAFGWMRAHDEANEFALEQLKPPKIPGVLLVLPLPAEPGSGAAFQASAQPYAGPLKYSALVAWLGGMAQALDSLYGRDNPMKAPRPIPQIRSDEDFQAHCVSKGRGVCVVGLLDKEGARGPKLVKMMERTSGKREDVPLHFSYIDAPRLRAFLEPFGVFVSDLPRAVALSPSRMRFAVLPTTLSGEAELSRFVDGVLSGQVKTEALERLPQVSDAGGERAAQRPAAGASAAGADDGGGAAAEDVSEEFDLSEILSEEVEAQDEFLAKEERMRRLEAEMEAERAEKEKAKKSKKSKKQAGKDEF